MEEVRQLWLPEHDVSGLSLGCAELLNGRFSLEMRRLFGRAMLCMASNSVWKGSMMQ